MAIDERQSQSLILINVGENLGAHTRKHRWFCGLTPLATVQAIGLSTGEPACNQSSRPTDKADRFGWRHQRPHRRRGPPSIVPLSRYAL